MRPVTRRLLKYAEIQYLQEKQTEVNSGDRNAGLIWDASRRSMSMQSVFQTLQRMMGDRQRCMYCLDSLGSDIEHFWPKSRYPERAFVWPNLLLCCTDCGRRKGDSFPLDVGLPLLIDPTVENPWLYLDFDPKTGNLTSRFEKGRNDFSSKGTTTVRLFQLSRREALAAGYKKTWIRLVSLVDQFLRGDLEQAEFLAQLIEADDHALLGWCFDGTGIDETPFREWREAAPEVWAACAERIRAL